MFLRTLALCAAFLGTCVASSATASPSPATAPSTLPDPCASAVPDLPNDLVSAFAYDLDDAAILPFITAVATVAPADQKRVFDAAVAAPASPGERAARAAIAATCPDLDEIYGMSRILYLVSSDWKLAELADAGRFSAFSDVVATAVAAIRLGERLTPAERNAALAPFAGLAGIGAATPAPNASGGCSTPSSDARALHIAEAHYPPIAQAAATTGSVSIKVALDGAGNVRYARVYTDTLGDRIGSAQIIRASVFAAAATTYAPATSDCKGVPGAYLFRIDFTR